MALTILKTGDAPIRGVLFDMDGVVIDTEKLYTRFWTEAANDLGWPMTREQALQLRSLGRGPGQAKLEAFFGPGVSYDIIRARRIELMDVYIATHGVEEKPGIRELLAFLKERNIPCAITSSSSIPVIRQHLGKLGLLGGFTALCSGKDVPRGKPAPDIYLHGAAALGSGSGKLPGHRGFSRRHRSGLARRMQSRHRPGPGPARRGSAGKVLCQGRFPAGCAGNNVKNLY